MIYTVSDIHGRYDKYRKLLARIGLGSDDILYVLGDVLDRGPDGFKILLDMAQRSNVVCLVGNHEAMAMAALPGLLNMGQGSNDEAPDAAELWFHNGGERSLMDFLTLNAEQMRTAWNYMRAMPLYREVEAGGRQFVLVHGGLGNFSPGRPLEDYQPRELYWCRQAGGIGPHPCAVPASRGAFTGWPGQNHPNRFFHRHRLRLCIPRRTPGLPVPGHDGGDLCLNPWFHIVRFPLT